MLAPNAPIAVQIQMCDVVVLQQLTNQLQRLICSHKREAFLCMPHSALRIPLVCTKIDAVGQLWGAQYGFQALRIRKRSEIRRGCQKRDAGGGDAAGVAKERGG
jgi:hypothetical protein